MELKCTTWEEGKGSDGFYICTFDKLITHV
jgi:hypothetical protein